MSRFDMTDQAYELYLAMQNKITEMYIASEEYPIFQKSSEEVLLFETEEYLQELFNNITAQSVIKYEEKKFMDKLKTIEKNPDISNSGDQLIESVITTIPEYIRLAKSVDSYTKNTRYADELLDYTEEICKLFQAVDGVINKEETDFTNPVMDNLKEFIKS